MRVIRLSKQGNMVLMENKDHPKGQEWFFLDSKVTKFASSLKEGDDIEFKNEDRGGENTITFLTKKGGSGGVVVATTGTGSEFKCEKCGAVLKDGKYKTCYGCSMELRKQEEESPEGKERQTSIEKQAILKASSLAVATALQGQVDVSALGDAIEVLYDRLLKKFRQ